MDRVANTINRGLLKARDSIVSFSRKLDPTANTEELENADICFSIDWKLVQLGLVAAAGLTTHKQYQSWYNWRFHGQKRLCSDDEDLKDDTVDTDTDTISNTPSSPPTAHITHSCSCKAAKLG
ncbi:hypothetical protein JVT61DRAFT_10348 [Boletus reticuloceps]|uniref:Uncharacterized protein n=1 Tax=Boletus reticuloceps TaxID=495285 RepID=A0A8I3ADU8_9AGAM|nr:hypothetical protein JVT61DRAFT_10348 [Boletus reticuloceps]